MTALHEWLTFYEIVGAAAAALIGLQFVAMAIIADVPMRGGEEGVNAFSSPTIVHFVAVLLLAAVQAMPWGNPISLASVWGIAGLSGLIYVLITLGRMRRQTVYKPVVEDWIFHALLPCVAYAGLTATALTGEQHLRGGLFGAAGAILLLLVIGIHNSWDNVTYLVFMRRDHDRKAKQSPEP